MSNNKRFDTFKDYSRHGAKVRIECDCGHAVERSPLGLVFQLNDAGLPDIPDARRFRCSKCGRKALRIYPVDR